MNKAIRPSWDQYFMDLAHVVKKRANCLRMDVGAIIVKDRRIIATGYNGTPHRIKNCTEGGCQRCKDRESHKVSIGQDKDKCVCVHAEQNAIIQSALYGSSTRDAGMYTTVEPCLQCSKLIINAGILRVTYMDSHHANIGVNLLKQAGVQVEHTAS